MEGPMPPRIDVIGVVVDDMAASLAFYRHLGLEFPHGAESEGHVEATLPGGLRLALDTIEVIKSFDAGWTPPSGGHRMALAFACDSPAEVDAVYSSLVEAGHAGHTSPWDAFWGQRYATVLDPSGNAVDLFAPLEG
jgi:uncharacterized glyoxalase superfamily protein PhnB